MKIFRAALILIGMFSGMPVSSEPIPVSSGEHGDFSRLVFEGQDLQGWSYEQTGDDHIVRFPRHRGGFGTKSVYKYIDKERLQSFVTDGSNFQFQIDCDCEVEVFEIGETVLVVDIKSRIDELEKQNEIKANFSEVSIQSKPFRFGASVPNLASETQPVSGTPVLPSIEAPERVLPFLRSTPNNSVLDTDALIAQAGTNSEVLQSMQARLLSEIGSASSKGVLNSNINFQISASAEARPQIDLRVFDSSEVDANPRNEPATQIRITSSADNIRSSKIQNQTTSLGHTCLDPERVEVLSWSDGRPFEQQIGEARRALFGEFDEVNSQSALKLARLYVHFGFGAEARSTLGLIETGRTTWPEIFEMAEILEYGYAKTGRRLQQMTDCNTAVALWAILARKNLNPNQIVDVQAALRELNALPTHLRIFLSPELSTRLLKYGDGGGAKNAMRNLDRLSIPADGRANLAKAEIEISKGELGNAEILFKDVVNSNTEFSAQALISLVETEMETGSGIDVATANLVEAYVTELRDAPIGAELRRVHVLALAKSGQFTDAFAALDELTLGEDAKPIRSKLMRLLTMNADDRDFLEIMFENMPALARISDKAQVLSTATRLNQLGFSESAEKLLNDGNVEARTHEQKLLRAQIALALGHPAAAEAFLFDLKGGDVDILRARVKEQQQDRVSAHDLYARLERQEAAQNNAWLSSQWQSLTNPDTAVFGPLVVAANQTLDQPTLTAGMLARSQNLLAESTETRELIDSILQNTTN